ncbi:MAG: VCBS repeat-containing protein [Chromatiales bacterium]|nr:VCBS repeat-containing protein [Chromatiales bacterium]
MTSGDYNKDGSPDLVVANYTTNSVSVLVGTGNGSFQTPVEFAVGSSPISFANGDLNGDKLSDLAVVNSYGYDISILLNTFGQSSPPTTTEPPPPLSRQALISRN